MENQEATIRKVGNATVIIHPGSAKTQEEINKVYKDLENALHRAQINNLISETKA